jgi:predicted HTH transcriptional regulator
MELVEQLGSGVPRILQAYKKDSFKVFGQSLKNPVPIVIREDDKIIKT